jgi:hypothetical protein
MKWNCRGGGSQCVESIESLAFATLSEDISLRLLDLMCCAVCYSKFRYC